MVVLCASASASPAPVDAIADGGFENTTCQNFDLGVFDCTNPAWTENLYQVFLCKSPPCSDEAAAGSGFLVLGGTRMTQGEEHGSVSQTVTLPETNPKILTFQLKGSDGEYAAGNVGVRLDDITYFAVGAADVSSTYAPESIDLSPYSGQHTITFDIACTRLVPIAAPCDPFYVDDVSLPAVPVDTAFARTPKTKTDHRRANFAFSTNADVPVYECSLDGDVFSPCDSPLRIRVDRGRHRMEVRAKTTSEADATPATYQWRVLRGPG